MLVSKIETRSGSQVFRVWICNTGVAKWGMPMDDSSFNESSFDFWKGGEGKNPVLSSGTCLFIINKSGLGYVKQMTCILESLPKKLRPTD